ncbi:MULTISPECIES: glycosyltransferase family 32 protein [Sphingobacterium]|jgi:mannosyltransferase OCH1-like enzyme|nr:MULTISPECIES: glycosyltransferase [Sphingobacterium]OFV10621.1 hypothetical protein HMPREF3127_21315 [Sphingobacterium sp. HMSC13C05]
MVPKIIHHITGRKPSDLVKTCLESWKPLSAYGFTFKIWNDEKIERFIKDNYGYALDAFKTARNHAEAADIARYLITFHYGGYYIDWDIHLISLKLFCELGDVYKNGYLVIDPLNDTLASEHFAAKKGEIFLLRIVDDIVETYNRGERDLMYTPQYSGPFRMKYSLSKHKYTSQQKIPVKEIFEYSYDEIRGAKEFLKSGIMVHFWEHSWL